MAIGAPKTSVRKRASYVFVAFFVLFCILAVYILKINIIDGEKLRTGAIEQQTRDYQVSSARGTIYDRNKKALAISSSAETISVNPKEIVSSGYGRNVLSWREADRRFFGFYQKGSGNRP